MKHLTCLSLLFVLTATLALVSQPAVAENLPATLEPHRLPAVGQPAAPVTYVPEYTPLPAIHPVPLTFTQYPVDGADLFSGAQAAPTTVSALNNAAAPFRSELYTLRRQPLYLGDIGDNATGRPLKDLSYLTIAPSGFAILRSGKPAGEALRWQQATETSMSYVRPHRKVQVMLEVYSEEEQDSMQARGMQAHAQVLDGLDVQVDSRDLGERSSAFGLVSSRPSQEKPHPGRMLAVGLNLGLLPAALGDCGISVAVVVGQSSNPGPFVSLLTNVAVPTSPPAETVPETEYRRPIYDIVSNGPTPAFNSPAGYFGDDDDDPFVFPGGEGEIIIVPEPVPEPATLLLLGLGGAALAARRRMRRASRS